MHDLARAASTKLSFDPAEPSILRFLVPRHDSEGIPARSILLVDHDLSDVAHCVSTLRRNGVVAEIVGARDGREATDWLFARGAHIGREPTAPTLMLVKSDLLTHDAVDVLGAVRGDPWTIKTPVIVLTRTDRMHEAAAELEGPVAAVGLPLSFARLLEAAAQVGALHALRPGSLDALPRS